MSADLKQLQQDFQTFILGQSSAAHILPQIAATPGLEADARLQIYFQAYRLRLRDALRSAFEKTHTYMGDSLFDACCAAYIEQMPSAYSNLRWYGDQFPAFLAQHQTEYPVCAELAAFEWALGLAFDAEDQALLDFAACQALAPEAWESIGFACQASLQFLHLHSNCVALWLALSEEEEPPAVEWQQEAAPWLVWRKNLQAHFRSLGREEYQALQQLQAGVSFAGVCAHAAEHHPQATEQIAGWLHTWVSEEMLQAPA